MFQPDDLDLAILEHLRSDGRKPYTEIAQALSVSEGTVRNRVARLIEKGVMQIVGLIDPLRMGYDAPAIIGVNVQNADIDDVARAIARFPEVSYLIMVSGGYDLIVEVICKDRGHFIQFLNQKLRKIPGVAQTQSFFILQTIKMAYGADPYFQPAEEAV
ncbi:MAG TPA: Lrp/AsnC family transcriptional regulator [Anaerolineae bacterium]|nr:Lrp/AsnC family transcriptional regulator [Anaerolineae bacterium]